MLEIQLLFFFSAVSGHIGAAPPPSGTGAPLQAVKLLMFYIHFPLVYLYLITYTFYIF